MTARENHNGSARPGIRRPKKKSKDGSWIEVRDGMRIDWELPIQLQDGTVLRADVYRPPGDGRYPAIMSYGPYGKLLHFEDLYTDQWQRMAEEHPDVVQGSTNKYQNWEVVDPEKWVPDGYACIRVDSRGAGRSSACAGRPIWARPWKSGTTRGVFPTSRGRCAPAPARSSSCSGQTATKPRARA